jgi:DNA processing protein
MKINRISPLKHNYLQIIGTIAKAPEKLYFIGELPKERTTTVAIVGTRKPTAYGKEVTYKIAYDLAKRGVVIVSGLALDVDAIAHKAALDAGGTTIAVLANGVDTVYPASNKQLADRILSSGGAILSEYPPGTSPRDYQFLARNRIVSGLSEMVLVTEAAARSGTLATVAHALDQGKEVGVIPGNINSPMSAGCNSLLKQGAHAICSEDDVLSILNIENNDLESQIVLPLGSNELENKIIGLINNGMRDGEEIRIELKIASSEFHQTISMLEINGVVRPLGNDKWTLS